jgi:methylated-DNA-[protein]-cysteine S-methyltransferase
MRKEQSRKYGFLYHSPIGKLTIVSDGEVICAVLFGDTCKQYQLLEKCFVFENIEKQLNQYFNNEREIFDVPLQLEGSSFQKKVWEALRSIPYGETRSYKQIAQQIGNTKACRAVGMANNHNPIAILVPCHRVIGSDGKLVGYGGGLDKKRILLDLEKNKLGRKEAE